MKTLTCVALAASLLSPLAMADNCRYSRDINFDVAVQGLERLNIDVGAGELNVTGAQQSDMISVRAKVCADSQRKLDDLDLTQDRRGDRLDIASEMGDSGWGSVNLFGSSYAYIDVNIAIPPGLVIDIDDGSGDISLMDVSGDFSIEDGSGGIEIARVIGDLRINDGSGDIRIETVGGNVTIDDDGSGDIRVSNVVGSFETEETGSGDVNYSDVRGRVDVR